MTARDFPCVAQIEPTDSGIQSICAFMILGRSGLPQTWPSDHAESSRRSWTFGWRTGASSGSGKPEGSDEAHLSPEMLPSTPSALRRRKATALAFQPTSVPAINSKALVVSRPQSLTLLDDPRLHPQDGDPRSVSPPEANRAHPQASAPKHRSADPCSRN